MKNIYTAVDDVPYDAGGLLHARRTRGTPVTEPTKLELFRRKAYVQFVLFLNISTRKK